MSRTAQATGRRTRPTATPWHLTPREVEAMDAIADGLTNLQAAERMGCALRTLENTLYSAYYRMDVTRGMAGRVQALRLWLEYRRACPL